MLNVIGNGFRRYEIDCISVLIYLNIKEKRSKAKFGNKEKRKKSNT